MTLAGTLWLAAALIVVIGAAYITYTAAATRKLRRAREDS